MMRPAATKVILMTITPVVLGACHKAPVPAATAADGHPRPGDLAQFQGTWSGTFGPDNSFTIEHTIEGNITRFRVVTPLGRVSTGANEIRIDETAKPHKAIDWIDRPAPGTDAGPVIPGIYEFEDEDTLRICNGARDLVRPSSFASPGTTVILLKRKPPSRRP